MVDTPAPVRVDSRWWYWLAATPLAFVFWLVTAAWVAVSVSMSPASTGGIGASLGIALAAIGIPLGVLAVLVPVALFRDVQAIGRTDADWTPDVAVYAGLAALGVVVGVFVGFAVGGASWPLVFLVVAYLVEVPVALYYLYRRHEHLGVP